MMNPGRFVARHVASAGAYALLLLVPLQGLAAPDTSPWAHLREASGRIISVSELIPTDSPFVSACEATLLIAQALSVVIIIGALIVRMQRQESQLEGVASILLKVAFIATVTFWRTLALDTAEATASAVSGGESRQTAVLASAWGLFAQWAPPGSPLLDSLEAQGAEPPASGQEEAWSRRGWNWARGVGATTDDALQVHWQATSGGLRAAIVFGGCAFMTTIVGITIFLAQLIEVLRVLLFEVGCATAPLFIAALGTNVFRSTGVRFLGGLLAVAFWPVGWALGSSVTIKLWDGIAGWMHDTTVAALNLSAGEPVPGLAEAAPQLAWGALLAFAAATVGVALWTLAVSLGVPLLFTRACSRGHAKGCASA